jgi:hypothetical protein
VSPCETCSDSSTTCLTCLASTHMIIAGSTCVCSVGYYELGGVCEVCDPSCFECYGPSPEECLSCASPLILDSLFTSCVCPSASYLTVSGTGKYSCSPCTIVHCTSCSSGTVCLSCSDNMVLSSNGASCVCADGFLFDSGSNSCVACQVPFCQQCINGVSTCTTCYAGSTTASCSCSPSSTAAADFDSRGDSCTLCHYSCLTCDGFEYNNCLSCSADRNYNSSLQTCMCLDGTYDNIVT